MMAFKRLKVKLKREIISIRQPQINPIQETVPYIEPQQFNK